MAKLTDINIARVSWQQSEAHLREIRTKVFIEEQQVDPDFEWDELDQSAVHLLAMSHNQPIGCLRIMDYKKIGRMAVLKAWRRLGVGNALLAEAIDSCREHGSQTVHLSAQTHAIGFYSQAGFVAVSDEYCDVHIPHVDMQLILPLKHS